MSKYCVIFAIGNGGVTAIPVKARSENQAAKRARKQDTSCSSCLILEIHKQEVRAI